MDLDGNKIGTEIAMEWTSTNNLGNCAELHNKKVAMAYHNYYVATSNSPILTVYDIDTNTSSFEVIPSDKAGS